MTPVRDAMIVAGGAGTRLHPLTATTPKPLLPFCNAPFLQGVIERLAGQGIEHVVLVVGADTAPFQTIADDAGRRGVVVTCVAEPEPLDTAGGVRDALERVGDTFLVLNGDVLTDLDVRAAVDAHLRARAAATIALTRVADTSTFGVCVREGTRIVDFVEKPAPGTLPGQDTVNAGTYVLERRVLEAFPRGPLSFERTVFPALVGSGEHVEGFVSDAVWTDLGTPERLRDGHRRVLDGELDWPTLAAHRHLRDMAVGDTAVHGDVWLGDGVVLDGDVVLRGPLVLGARTQVTAGAVVGPHVVIGADARVAGPGRIQSSVIFDRAEVAAPLDAAIVGFDAQVAAGAQLGSGVVIGDGAVIGASATIVRDARVEPREHVQA